MGESGDVKESGDVTAGTGDAAVPPAVVAKGLRKRYTTVADVMTRHVLSVRPDTPFADVAKLVFTCGVRAVPVLDTDDTVLGVVSEADLVITAERADPTPVERPDRRWWRRARHIRRPRPEPKVGATTAGELMSSPVCSVAPDMTVACAARTMRRHGLSWLPVLDGGRLVGVLGRSDLLMVFLRDDASIRTEVVEDVLDRVLRDDAVRVGVAVRDGVVTLSGRLDLRTEAEAATRFVERVEGVVRVISRLGYRLDDRSQDAGSPPE